MTSRLTLLLAALVIAACGGPSTAAGPSPDDAVTGAPAKNDDTKTRPELREPQEDIVDAMPRSFESHKAKGRKITLVYYSGVEECYGLDHIDIQESKSRVVLTIYEGRRREAEICPEMAVQVRSIAALDAPLGNRKVVDGAR